MWRLVRPIDSPWVTAQVCSNYFTTAKYFQRQIIHRYSQEFKSPQAHRGSRGRSAGLRGHSPMRGQRRLKTLEVKLILELLNTSNTKLHTELQEFNLSQAHYRCAGFRGRVGARRG